MSRFAVTDIDWSYISLNGHECKSLMVIIRDHLWSFV